MHWPRPTCIVHDGAYYRPTYLPISGRCGWLHHAQLQYAVSGAVSALDHCCLDDDEAAVDRQDRKVVVQALDQCVVRVEVQSLTQLAVRRINVALVLSAVAEDDVTCRRHKQDEIE